MECLELVFGSDQFAIAGRSLCGIGNDAPNTLSSHAFLNLAEQNTKLLENREVILGLSWEPKLESASFVFLRL